MLITQPISFHKWMTNEGYSENTVSSRVSEINRIKGAYPMLDKMIQNGTISKIEDDFIYSKEDANAGKQPKHNIPISGNVYNGTASLRSALRLYTRFYRSVNPSAIKTPLTQLKDSIVSVIDSANITYNKALQNSVKARIQIPLLSVLKQAFPNIEWDMEQTIQGASTNDRVDILGSLDENTVIIIEIDNTRADQVTKKYVSREALAEDKNVIYISVCYSNNNQHAGSFRTEVEKYVEFIKRVNETLNYGSVFEKVYGHAWIKICNLTKNQSA